MSSTIAAFAGHADLSQARHRGTGAAACDRNSMFPVRRTKPQKRFMYFSDNVQGHKNAYTVTRRISLTQSLIWLLPLTSDAVLPIWQSSVYVNLRRPLRCPRADELEKARRKVSKMERLVKW